MIAKDFQLSRMQDIDGIVAVGLSEERVVFLGVMGRTG
jgi:hypothetical protein